MAQVNNLYIQYGCGYVSHPEGWANFDSSPTLFLQRIPIAGIIAKKYIKPRFPDNVIFSDITKGLSIRHESCRGIYCSHVLEHLSLEDFRIVLKNTYDYLAPNGIFRLVMPDLAYLTQQYINSNDTSASIRLIDDALLGSRKREKSIIGFFRSYLGNSQHLWLWDFKSTKAELEKVNFRLIRRAYYGDSIDPKFIEVEEKSRWDNCLGIECIK